MQVNLLSNDLYDTYIEERYDLLDKKDTAGLDELNKKSNFFSLAFLINKIRDTFFLKFFGIGFRTHQLVAQYLKAQLGVSSRK